MFIFGTLNDSLNNSNKAEDIVRPEDKEDDFIFGGPEGDIIDGTDGRDVIVSEDGSDIIQAGIGSDLIFAGDGSDRVIHVASERAPDDFDFASGGDGTDTLELVLTQAELLDPVLAAEIEAFRHILSAGDGAEFTFDSLNLMVQGFEELVITVIDDGNSPPEVAALETTLGEDGAAIAYDLLSGTSDPDGDALTVENLPTEIVTREGRVLVAGTDFETTGGQFTLTDIGRSAFNGLAEGGTDEILVTFQVSDGTASVANTFTLTITGENDPASISGPAAGAVSEDGVLNATGTLSVDDPDDREAVFAAQAATAGQYGTFSITELGVWTYALSNGSQTVQDLSENEVVTDSFTVTSADGTATETIEITITGAAETTANVAPVAVDDAFNGDEDDQIAGNVLLNDSDADSDALTAVLVSGVSNGQLVFNADGSFTYTPDADFNGADAFTYLANDGTEDGNTAIVTLEVGAVNDPPAIGASLSLEADEDGAVQSIDLLSGTTDIDGDTLSIANVSALPAGATLVGSTLSIDPSDAAYQSLAEGDSLTAAVAYDVIDGNGGVAPQTLNVTINGINDDPTVGLALTLDADEDGAVQSIDLLSGASDVDGDTLSIANVSSLPAGATLVGSTLSIDPSDAAYQSLAEGDSLTAAIAYDVIDGNGGIALQTLNVTITGINDDPTVGPALTLDADEDGAVQSIDLLSGATDVDGDTLSIANISSLADGLSLAGTSLTVDPTDPAFDALEDGETETISVTYDVTDGNGGSAAQSLTITVNGETGLQPPATPTLGISSTDQSAQNETEAARVALVGVTSPGVVVELQSADGSEVLASALSDLDGNFRLPDVELDVGVSDFRVVARDPETGLESSAGVATFLRTDPDPDAPANAVLEWIEIALETVADSGTTPDYASRALAMQSIAVQNALAAINDEDGYLFSFDGTDADAEFAVAYAAHAVLSGLFAGQSSALDQKLDDFIAAVIGGGGPIDITAQAAAQALGEAAAARVLEFRREDGWDVNEIYIGSNEDGEWRPTGPAYFNALNPQWADLDPFTLATGDQFRPDEPPSLLGDSIDGDAYDSDLARVRALGSSDSTDRTADQTQIARFWADGSGTETPPGHWNRIAAQVSQAEGLSLSQSADLMLKLNLSLADAAIAAWDTKFAYDFWRPVTVLNEGTTIDLTEIMADPDWAPLLPTPAHPEYVSGHSTYSGAAATVLTATFGEDYAFADTAETTSGDITRSFESFWDAANEGGESRIFGGIHFDFSNFTGLTLGTDVANWVLQSFDPLNDVIDPTIVLTNLDPDAVAVAPVVEGILTDNLSGALTLLAIVDDTTTSDVTADGFGNFTFDPGPLADGFHSIRFIGQDAAGNTGEVSYEFSIAGTPPTITLTAGSVSDANTALAEGARIIGDIDLADGAAIAALTVQIDGGPVLPLNFDTDGMFDAALQIGALVPGAHTVTLRVVDTAGNETIEIIDATLAERPPFRVLDLLPDDRETSVGSTIHPFVQFNRAVDPATLDSDSFYAVTATGERVPANITLLNDGTGAWMFFDEPLPGSTAIELIVDGELIRAADGAALDGDADGVPGGALVQRFTTVALEGLETTTLSGRIVDPGTDLFMMTPDDFISGPGGVTDYANHQYRNPIEGAEVHVLGRPDLAVLTGPDGSFELTGLPAGKVKIVVDGRTATNAPSEFYWPEMVLDVEIRPGQANTIMGGMGPLEAQLERQEDQAFFLPRVPTAALTEVPDDAPITIRPVTAAGTNLTPEQFELISLEVQPNSMIDAQGDPILNPELGLAIVPSDMVIDMLPDGVPVPPIFLTIQGPDGGVFTEEAVLTIPNVFGLAPGEKTEFFSYDHQTGLLVVNGVGTVSQDGTFIQTDPGSGILQPGWNGPIRISRILIDPQLPCPPGTNHPNSVDPAPIDPGFRPGDALTDVSDLQRRIDEKYGEITEDSSFFLTNPAATFFRRADARIGQTLDTLMNGVYAGDPGGLGGEVDAGWYGIVGTKFVGDVADTFLEAGSFFGPLNAANNARINGARAGIEGFLKGVILNKTQNLAADIATGDLADVSGSLDSLGETAGEIAQNGISGKFGPNTPQAQRFEDHQQDIEDAQDRLEEIETAWEEVQEQAQIIDDTIERVRDDYGDLFDALERGDEITPDQLDQLVGPEGTPGSDSPLLDEIEIIADAVEIIQENGSALGLIYEIYGILFDIVQENDDLLGEAEGTISLSDLGVPPSQVEGEYDVSYGPVQYVLLTNLDTGEEQRFTLKSGATPLQPTSPGANYAIEIFDPVSGFTGASAFVAPRPFAVNSLTNLALLPRTEPVLRSTGGEAVGPGGLTEQQAHIVGADFSATDSLLPGTNITDRQALISGLGSSPGSINLNGVTGQLSLDGTAEAVAIGSTSANGADLTAYVATGDLGLAIVDISNSLQPILLGQIDLPGFAEDVAAVDQLDLVAVALGDAGLAVVNVRDPIRPVLDAVYDTLIITQVIALGDRLIIGQDGRVRIIDAASGVELASIGVGVGPEQQFEALAYEDGQIYALGDDGNLHVVSIDGTDLENRGVIDLADELLALPDSPQIATQDGVLWIGSVGTGSGGGVRGGMVTVDATDPDAPALIGDIDTSNTVSDFAGDSVAVNGSGFGVASRVLFDNGTNSQSRLTVFDSRDPAENDNEVTEFRFDGETRDVAIAAGEAFVATGSEGLQIVRFLGIDTQGTAPTISTTTLPEDVDDAVAGLQVFQGQTISFDVATDDDIQVRSVDVILNGNVILSTVAYPWDLTVTLPTIADLGTDLLEVQFRATDTGGNSTTTDPVQLQMVTDVTPFEIVDITPDDGDSLLPGSVRSITVTFSKSVESDTVNADTFQLMGPSGTVTPASISVRDSGTEVQLTYPTGSFGSGAFTLTIDADNVTDRAGTPLAAIDVTSSFDIQVVGGQTWIGTTDGTWNDPVNWASGRPPESGDDVVLPMTNGVVATISASAGDVNSVNVSGTGTLRVLTQDTGTDLTAPILSNTGNIDVALGQVEVSTQTVNSGDLAVTSTLVQNNSGQTVALPGELGLTGDLTNTGVLRASEGGQIELAIPVIDNQFEIRVESSVADLRGSTIRTTGALTELTGGGTLILDTETDSTRIASFVGSVGTAEQGVIDEILRNVDNTITGSGNIGAGFVLENTSGGLIEAGDGDSLRVTSGRIDNDGVMQALTGGSLTFDSDQIAYFGGLFAFRISTFIDNQDGTILADGGQVNFTDSTVSGGLLQATNGGFFTMFSAGNGFAKLDGGTTPVTIQGQLIATSLVQTEGTIDNQGFLSTGLGPSFGTEIQIIEDTTFTGGGQINLFSGDVASDDRVATIVNDYEVLYDDETGEPLFDEFGQVQVEYETRLSLQDQLLSGSGRVGTSEEEGDFGTQPLFKIDLSSGSVIDANQPDGILEFLNTEVTLASGTTLRSSSGGILNMIDSDVFNSGIVEIFGGGEIRFEVGAGTSEGGFFFNSGDVNIFSGSLYSDVTLFNRGDLNIFGGEADLSFLNDDVVNGGRTTIGDARLTLREGASANLDVGAGDAEVVVENSFDFTATIFDFESGDAFHFTDLDDSGPLSLTFNGSGNSGTLTVDDGSTELDLFLISTGGGLSGVTGDDFSLAESDFGGLVLETTLEFI